MHKPLADGLILRSISEGVPSDRENLAAFYKGVFTEADGREDIMTPGWTESLLADTHPATTDDDIWVVVDPAENDKIVSALLLIPQTWMYGGVPMGVGRVELVATDPAYRRRGLVRQLMDALHERSAEYGHVIQAITGIPHYYRRFGYAMTLNLGGHAAIPMTTIPDPDKDKSPDFTLRPATEADAENLAAWDAYAASKYGVYYPRTADLWRYELTGRESNKLWKLDLLVIQDSAGAGVGYVVMRDGTWGDWWGCLACVIGEQSSFLAAFPDVLVGLKQRAAERFKDAEKIPTLLNFDSGMPEAFDLMAVRNFAARVRQNDHYAWYIRAASPARLIETIAPVLERRLAGSGANRYTGTLTINFYALKGLRITFEDGRITGAEDITLLTPQEQNKADAAFPWDSFLNIVFGHRTAEELKLAMPEVSANAKAAVLLATLFPRQRAAIMPLA